MFHGDGTRHVTWLSGATGWKIVLVVGLRVYFAGIQSLFAFILLTHKIMIVFCIGVHWALCGRVVLF